MHVIFVFLSIQQLCTTGPENREFCSSDSSDSVQQQSARQQRGPDSLQEKMSLIIQPVHDPRVSLHHMFGDIRADDLLSK